jgi:hypothetical protein
MSLSGRGKLADKGTVYTTRVSCLACWLSVLADVVVVGVLT